MGAILALETLSQRDYLSPDIATKIMDEAKLRADLPMITAVERDLILDDLKAQLAEAEHAKE